MSENNNRFKNPLIVKERFNDEGVPTNTSDEQIAVEDYIFHNTGEIILGDGASKLLRFKHIYQLNKSLQVLPYFYQDLDASRPWLCYWIIHSLSLLDVNLDNLIKTNVVSFLKRCQCATGGYGGGPGQDAHLATTYAAINTLCILGTEEAYNSIDRENLLQFIYRMKQKDGSFIMHEGGEADIRAVYCALSVANLTGICCPELTKGSAEWISSCQTYEGGFGGTHDSEAHGGYTFCGLAALSLLNKTHIINIKSLLRWLSSCQMRFEGGFQGRTNKLVDSCYSFWQGCSFPLIHRILLQQHYHCMDKWLFNQEALQEYILFFCQSENGGLRDKPQKNWDLYHTCYALSGLSVAQHSPLGKLNVLGDPQSNLLNPTHPFYNIGLNEAYDATNFFNRMKISKVNLDENKTKD